MSQDISDLRAIANGMDTKFRGPFGWRFGWDGLIGMIPIAGDMITNSISVYVVLRAAQIGCPPSVIARMGLNILVENIVDVVPFFGNLFDFIWKSNSKNLALIERYVANPSRTARGSRAVLFFTIAAIIALIVGGIALSILALRGVLLWWASQG